MKFNFKEKTDLSTVVLLFEDEKTNSSIQKLIDKGTFKASKGKVISDSFAEKPTIYVGLGKKEKLDFEALRLAGFTAAKEANRLQLKELYVDIPVFENLCYAKSVSAFLEGFLQSEAVTDRYKSEKDKRSLEELYIKLNKDSEEVQRAVKEMEFVMQGVASARTLVNERSNTMTPSVLADYAKKLLEPLGVELEVFDLAKLKEIKAYAFLEVARGSDEEPRGIIMRWKGNKNSSDLTGLVGKGLTYDSGGYCIKTPGGMSTMHTDMAGAASVIATMEAIARNKLKINVTALVFACENLISGKAYKTGDIINSMKGTTIWVGNTDAEGRLTLADAVYYMASVEKPNRILEVATLTGAVIGALGYITTGVVTNDEHLANDFVAIGKESGEAFHILPLNDEYREMIKHDEADLANSLRDVGAGSITAGAFVEHFVENIPWVHLDIAGTADGKARGYLPSGAHGTPVKTFYYYLKSLSK